MDIFERSKKIERAKVAQLRGREVLKYFQSNEVSIKKDLVALKNSFAYGWATKKLALVFFSGVIIMFRHLGNGFRITIANAMEELESKLIPIT